MIRGAILTTAVAGAFFENEPDLTDYTYKAYIEKFGKNAEAFRESIFNENLKKMKEHNSNPDKNWVMGPNKLADWTPQEILTLKMRNLPIHQFDVVEETSIDLTSLPERVDWRDKFGVVTPTKDQGQCGSCWAFSATETMESHYAIATGEHAPILSPQQIVSCCPNPRHCGGKGGCDGSTQPVAFNYTSMIGLTRDKDYPYKAETLTCDHSKIKPVAINSGFKSLKSNNYEQLVHALAHHGPIAISVAANWELYAGGVFDDPKCGYVMDHAVQMVGYGKVRGTSNVMYWLVRNSWGPAWGEGGYIRLKRFGKGKEPCGVDEHPHDGDACDGDNTKPTYCGMCAVLSSSSYPTNVRKAHSESIVV